MADKMRPKTIVRATTHPGDTRPNIPTAELESFARPEEKRPAIVRYPRGGTFDPPLGAKDRIGHVDTKRSDPEALASLRHAIRRTSRRRLSRQAH